MGRSKYIDAHIHLDQYNDDEIRTMFGELDRYGVEGLVAVSNDMSSCLKTQALYNQYPQLIRPAYGFHPEQPILPEKELHALLDWMKGQEMAAIGEVGLPFYTRRATIADEGDFRVEPYIEWLESCIRFAAEADKPIVLHAVYDDAEIACDLLERHQVVKAHFHWFKGSEKTTQRLIRNGYYISVTPDIVYEQKIWRLAAQYPLERMMVETDGPWPFTGPFAGKRTHPWMLAATVEKLASIKKLTSEECARIVLDNTRRLYGSTKSAQ